MICNKFINLESLGKGGGSLSARCGMECFPLMTSNSWTFFRINDMMPILLRTCWRLRPSLGTPSANDSALSFPGSHRCLMKRLM